MATVDEATNAGLAEVVKPGSGSARQILHIGAGKTLHSLFKLAKSNPREQKSTQARKKYSYRELNQQVFSQSRSSSKVTMPYLRDRSIASVLFFAPSLSYIEAK